MPHKSYDRLSAMDTSFLVLERPHSPLHISCTLVYDAGPLATPEGGVDFAASRAATGGVLHRIPRYRQRLEWIPVFGHPVWVDDPDFELDYHVRHTSLPRPGSVAQLKKLSARIMAQPLDPSRPLWESWVVEGLEGGRFAVISKIHHCMIDGVAGQDLSEILHQTDPAVRTPPPPSRFYPRETPSRVDLLRDEVGRYLSLPGRALRGLRAATRELAELRDEVTTRARSVARMMSAMQETPSQTCLNQRIGPHRRFDWRDMALDDVKAVRKALGCSINDVVLATVTGAVREFLLLRGERVDDVEFKIAAPVSIRSPDDPALGNRVSNWFVRAPIDEADPVRRVERIREATEELKETKQALDADLIMNVAEWTPTVLLTLASRAASGSAPYNLMVTNVPGVQVPLYLLGARLEGMYPQVPIADSTALGVALVSYAGKLCWGFNADLEVVPDLETFASLVESSFQDLAKCAGVELSGSGRGGA